MNYQGLTVEIIRILWEHGYFRGNKLLQRIHSYWFDYWVEFKTNATMADVDRQIEMLREPSGVDKPIYTESPEGEMRLTAPWHNENLDNYPK